MPACTARKNLHGHHIVFRSLGGPDASWNRTTLCAWHHLRGVHGGRIRVVGRAPDHLVFELGVRRYRSGDREVTRKIMILSRGVREKVHGRPSDPTE